ncbi:MAG TPA: hypothetical protein DEA96_05055 [Leptospiraceae bacterium]|nr:hypothetical protein [Spirochaetaceae bacterium]HBS04313.1 hypothetical protein [Leptospiraceae bacterium]
MEFVTPVADPSHSTHDGLKVTLCRINTGSLRCSTHESVTDVEFESGVSGFLMILYNSEVDFYI